MASAIGAEMFTDSYADVFAGDQQWQSLPTPEGEIFEWDPDSTYVRKPPYFEGMPADPVPVTDIAGARVLLKLGDSITTDHISPAGSIKADAPAGIYLSEHGVDRREFNSYGSRRGNHEVMIRGTFANIRLRNQLAPGTEGGFTRDFSVDDAPVTTMYEASEHYLAAGIPLVILTGKEYGSGSSRDWAAKGTALLGVKAVIAESYERIHRSNLIGMGVLPLQFPEGQTADTLGSDRGRDLRHHRRHRTQQRHHPGHRHRHRRRTSASTPSSGSTPPAKPTTTATAASCNTSSAASSSSNRRAPGDPDPGKPKVPTHQGGLGLTVQGLDGWALSPRLPTVSVEFDGAYFRSSATRRSRSSSTLPVFGRFRAPSSSWSSALVRSS